MNTSQFDPKKAMMVTKMIFLGQLMGVLFFMIIVFYMGKENFSFSPDFSSPFFITLFLLTVIVNPVVNILASRRNASVSANEPLSVKYTSWQISLIMRLAAAEAIALFSAVCLLITGNMFLGIFFLLALGLLAFNYPSVSKITREMKLSESEIDLFYRNL